MSTKKAAVTKPNKKVGAQEISSKKTSAKKIAKEKAPAAEMPSPLPDRKEVVQLATELVSAQIAAHSHHETAMSLFEGFRQMAFDVAVLLREDPKTQPDLNPVVAAIVESLKADKLRKLRIRKPRALQPMSHPDLDRLFQSAMRRSFVMLNAPFDTERVVFAEQIYTSYESLTRGAIQVRFKDFRWPEMKSPDPIISLMNDVNRWFEKHMKALEATQKSVGGKEAISALDQTIPISIRIEAEAERLSWLLDQASDSGSLSPESRSSYQALESALSQFTSTCNRGDLGGALRSLDSIDRINLIFVMFGGNGPYEVTPSDKTKAKAKTKDDPDSEGRNIYRPWAIFRYLRRFGNEAGDELGMDLNRRLRAPRSDLNPARIPDIAGIEPSEFDFGPLHEDVKTLLDQLASEGAFPECAADSNALQMHGFSPQDIAFGRSELDVTDSKCDDEIPPF